jgi:2-methylisocitrate lyase-like PEP mutase family enzyme
MSRQSQAATAVRALLLQPELIIMPCCYDAFSARLIQLAGCRLTFMSGFAVAAARLGLPDTGLISYAEMLDQGRNICSAVDIPVIGDGDTGYGNAVNIKRTVHGYIQAGFAGIMIEDQRSPKRCGHTQGTDVVERAEALQRMRAAIEAREEARARGEDIVIVARTDARATRGLAEALARIERFAEMGAEILFVEAPTSPDEMQQICRVPGGCHMANVVERGGKTPVLPPPVLQEMGYRIAAYPLTLLSAAGYAMRAALDCLAAGTTPENIFAFKEIMAIVGFPEYDKALQRLTESKNT